MLARTGASAGGKALSVSCRSACPISGMLSTSESKAGSVEAFGIWTIDAQFVQFSFPHAWGACPPHMLAPY